MVRTLTSTVERTGQTLLLPGATEAEPWELWTIGPRPECVRMLTEPADGADRRSTVALPVGQVFAMPVWLHETDPDLLAGMIALQLEARGLQSRVSRTVFAWSVVIKEDTRTLVLVGVLAATIPKQLESCASSAFDLSARCYGLPSDALVVWKEQNRLVLAVTRQNRLAYFQALPDEALTTRALQDITCVVAALHMEEVIAPLDSVVLWFEPTQKEIVALEATLGLPVRQELRPSPNPASDRWILGANADRRS